MKLHLSFPGRAGDILWALPSMRAISEALGKPLDLSICGEFKTIIPLLKAGAPYLGEITAWDHWRLVPPREWDAPITVEGARLVHLGYRGWPHTDLPHCVYEQVQREYPDIPLAPLDLDRPWITVEPSNALTPREIVVGWTETWFELKVGLLFLLGFRKDIPPFRLLTTPGSRWVTELDNLEPLEWLEAAQQIQLSSLFLGDCSALHVLALAIGKPCVIVEPMQDRLNPIFWSFGQDGPRVTLVRGLDGQATNDARHTAQALQRALSGLQRPSGRQS